MRHKPKGKKISSINHQIINDMRTTKEINAEIDSVRDQINKLNGKKAELTRELIVSAEAEFETQMNVKRGDPIKTENGTKFFYDGFV